MIANPSQTASLETHFPPKSVAERRRDALRYGEYPKIKTVEGLVLAVDENGIVYPGRRWDLHDRPREDEIGAVEDYLNACAEKIKSCPVSSYGLKHVAEAWRGRYCSNGAALVAASRAGFPISWKPGDGLNAGIGVSRRSLAAPCGPCVSREVSK